MFNISLVLLLGRASHRHDERSQSIYVYDVCILCMVRPSPARRYIQCTATRDILRRPHEETSAFSGTYTKCIIIAESAKRIYTLGLPQCQNLSRERPDSDRDLGHAPALPGMPSY